MQTLKTLASIVLSLPGLASCGGEDASAGAVSLGISSNKALSAVTREEATRGCARLRVDVGARFNPTTLKRKVCTLTAASFSHDESECASRRDSCVQDPSSVDYDPADHVACGGENVDDWQGCTTTVGELETCLNDLLDGLDAMLNTFTCKDAGKVLGSN